MGEQLDAQASDAERERTAQTLREHFAAGRLGSEELNQRVQAAYAAAERRDDRRALRDERLGRR